jgi:hypothetical protein
MVLGIAVAIVRVGGGYASWARSCDRRERGRIAAVRDKNEDASRADMRSNQRRFTKTSCRQRISEELKFDYSIGRIEAIFGL